MTTPSFLSCAALIISSRHPALAATKPRMQGDGARTLLVNSGWAWTLKNQVSKGPFEGSIADVPNEEGVILQLDTLNSLAKGVKSRDNEAILLQSLDVFGVHFVAVAMTLLDDLSTSVHAAKLAPFSA
jgi:hypothetical protein